MPRYVAFLRAINVGGRVVKMERLRAILGALPLTDVETHIASGNAIFDARARDAAALERRIEAALEEALGYRVDTFVRTLAELAAVARHRPFGEVADGDAILVHFTRAPLDGAAAARLAALATGTDDFHHHGREVWWRRHGGRVSDSTVTPARLEKALGMPATGRNLNTVEAIVARWGG